MEALRQIYHPKYTGIIFRRTFPMLEQARGIIQRSREWYPSYGGTYNDQKHYWMFPSGARIYFGHMQYIKDMYIYQGAEFTFVGFDELTEFEREQYMYLFTRCRSAAPGELRAYIRSGTNPGNIGHQWVKRRFITRDIVNQMRHFAMEEEEDTEVDPSHPNALSRAFYPAKLEDNPSADPQYRQRIRATGDPVLIARLEDGDWDVARAEGLIYDTFSGTLNVSAEAEFNPDLPLYWACDDGYVYGEGPGYSSYHPRVILFVQDNVLGGMNVVDELVMAGETHDQTLTTALGKPDGSPPDTPTRWQLYPRPLVAYVPSEAAMFKGEIHKRGITTVNATHRVVEGIRVTRQLICDGNDMRRLLINPRCKHVIYEVSEYRSDPNGRADEGEIVPLKVDDHTMDALRYIAFKRRHYTQG